MRVSSVMWPASSCGTFRSARMNTRWPLAWPWAQRSEKRMKFMEARNEQLHASGQSSNCRRSPDSTARAADRRARRPTSPSPVQRQVHRHAGQDGAQHAAPPEEPGGAGQRGEQARVLPGARSARPGVITISGTITAASAAIGA